MKNIIKSALIAIVIAIVIFYGGWSHYTNQLNTYSGSNMSIGQLMHFGEGGIGSITPSNQWANKNDDGTYNVINKDGVAIIIKTNKINK